MKQLNFLITASLLTLSLTPAYGAYHVTTETSNKNVLMDYFTGVKCTNCVNGDKQLEIMLDRYKGSIFPVAYHSPEFARPSDGYMTPEMTEISKYLSDDWQLMNWPSAWINRHHYEGSYLATVQLDFWETYIKENIEKYAPVNLWCYAYYNDEDNTITVDVEGYIVDELASETAYLNVMMTQSGIIGYQQNAPNAYNYTHNYMLRACLTPTWGEEITECKQGTYFSRQYVYEVPEFIGGVDIVVDNLYFVCFLTETKEEVINVNGCNISYEPAPEAEEEEEPETPDPGEEEDPGVNTQVNSIGENSLPTVVFDLNGRPVNENNLLPGIYIVKSGSEVRKTIIR